LFSGDGKRRSSGWFSSAIRFVVERNSTANEKIARAPGQPWRFIWSMRPESIANRQTWTAPTNSRRPAAPCEPENSSYRHSSGAERITVLDRPLVEAEWTMVRAFMRRMEREDLRRRFGHPFDFEDEVTLRRFIAVKTGIGEIAWVADESAAIAGISHRVMVSRSEAEIGLIVRSDLQRVGIGEFLLRQMLSRSARQGVKTLSGLVLWENRPMLRLAAKIGYVPRELSAWTVELAFEVGRTTAAC